MPQMWRAAVDAKCPYFDRESKFAITCEGVHNNTMIKTEFETEQKKIEFQKQECFKYPNNCYIAKMKDDIYGS